MSDPAISLTSAQIALAFVTIWGSLVACIGYIRHLYESRDAMRQENIKEMKERIERLEQRDEARGLANERALAALEQAVAISTKQTEIIERQQEAHRAGIDAILERLDDAKGMRRARSGAT